MLCSYIHIVYIEHRPGESSASHHFTELHQLPGKNDFIATMEAVKSPCAAKEFFTGRTGGSAELVSHQLPTAPNTRLRSHKYTFVLNAHISLKTFQCSGNLTDVLLLLICATISLETNMRHVFNIPPSKKSNLGKVPCASE